MILKHITEESRQIIYDPGQLKLDLKYPDQDQIINLDQLFDDPEEKDDK